MAIFEFEGKNPKIDPTAYVHPEATIIGDVTIGANCYIGPGARIRGDWGTIKIGDGSNVQENCVIHVAPDAEVNLAINSHIGHGSVIHGATLEEHVVVGINAVVLDGAVIGSGSFLGAGTVVAANKVIPPRSLVVGIPGKIISEVSDQLAEKLRWGTGVYQTLPKRYRETLKEIPIEDK